MRVVEGVEYVASHNDMDLHERVKKYHDLDLGNGYYLKYFQWNPDRKLNPKYEGVPDVPKCGAHIACPHGDVGAVTFIIPGHLIFGSVDRQNHGWKVESWDPLTISPSVQFMNYINGQHVAGCCHGFIREGRWVNA